MLQDTQKIIQGATWFGLGTAIGIVLEYAINGTIAFFLGPVEYGIFNVGIRVFTISLLLSLMASPSSLSFFIPVFEKAGNEERTGQAISVALGLNLIGSLVVGAGLFMMSSVLAKRVFNEPGLVHVLQPLAVGLPGATFLASTAGALRGFKLSRQASLLTSTYDRGLRFLFILLFLWLGWGLFGVGLAYIPASLLAFFFGFRNLINKFDVFGRFSIRKTMLTRIFTYSGPLLVSQLLTELRNSTHPLLLAYFLDSRAVGLFSIANLIAGSFGMVLVAFNFLYVPVISGLSFHTDFDRIKRIFQMVSTWGLTLLFPVWAVIVLFPEPFLMFFGSQYAEGAWALRILITGAFLSVSMGALGTTLLASGQTRVYLVTNIVGIVAGILLSLGLIPAHGLIGASTAYAITILIWNSVTLVVIYQRFRLHPLNKTYLMVTLVNLAGMLPLSLVANYFLQFSFWIILAILPIHYGLVQFFILRFRLMDEDNLAVAYQTISEYRIQLDKLRNPKNHDPNKGDHHDS